MRGTQSMRWWPHLRDKWSRRVSQWFTQTHIATNLLLDAIIKTQNWI